ncbi:MAG: TlpA family protein disulfide reductase, partial [Acidobacteria bacterium]|nr:TlpA family protein disulfide reductase [Acidobacteriota bacterium]
MKSKWLIGAAVAIALGLLTLPPMLRSERSSGPPVEGAACKQGTANLDFTLKDMNGADFKLADLKGKVVLLNFWATWCAPCLVEIP